MPKRVKKVKRLASDPNRRAHQLFDEHMAKLESSPKWKAGDSASASTPVPELTPSPEQIRSVMVELGRRGGKVSGARRMTNLTPAQRSEIALKAATKRWERERKKKRR